MPPSCRVRRGSILSPPTYAPLGAGANNQTQGVNAQNSPINQDGVPPQRRMASLQPGSTRSRGQSEATNPQILQPGSGNRARRSYSEATRPWTVASAETRETSSAVPPPQPYPSLVRSHSETVDGAARGSMVRMPSYGLVSGHFGSRRSQLRPRGGSSSSDAPASNEVALHGFQVDILVPNQPESGLADNSLDHSIGYQPEHHEDDIVEHLEAIGVFHSLSVAPYSTSCLTEDPYVATVSHLSNAANSILMSVPVQFPS
jgi:hypothetical protein